MSNTVNLCKNCAILMKLGGNLTPESLLHLQHRGCLFPKQAAANAGQHQTREGEHT
jgi:hypothetical protein